MPLSNKCAASCDAAFEVVGVRTLWPLLRCFLFLVGRESNALAPAETRGFAAILKRKKDPSPGASIQVVMREE